MADERKTDIGPRADRFGYTDEDVIGHLDEKGNKITEAQFRRRVAEKAKAAKKGR